MLSDAIHRAGGRYRHSGVDAAGWIIGDAQVQYQHQRLGIGQAGQRWEFHHSAHVQPDSIYADFAPRIAALLGQPAPAPVVDQGSGDRAALAVAIGQALKASPDKAAAARAAGFNTGHEPERKLL